MPFKPKIIDPAADLAAGRVNFRVASQAEPADCTAAVADWLIGLWQRRQEQNGRGRKRTRHPGSSPRALGFANASNPKPPAAGRKAPPAIARGRGRAPTNEQPRRPHGKPCAAARRQPTGQRS
jgi:hypothetical protein